jgi:membrane-anchored mycosin MYCP
MRLAALIAVMALLPGMAQPAGPPALPLPADGCVGASAVRYTELPWATARMAPYLAWQLATGKGVTVAVLDSGVSPAAEGLAGVVAEGLDVVVGGPAWTDCLGRGTALASIVAGRPVTGSGIVGIAPAARILPIRIIDPLRRVNPASLAAGIREALRLGAGVILLGTGLPEDTADLRAAVADAVALNAVIIAPVNDRTPGEAGNPPEAWFPAAYPEVLAVGGMNASDEPTEATGPASGLDILAPAVGSVVPGPSGGHYAVAGTPVAAAYVAGVAALIREYYPKLDAAGVRARLTMTAQRSGPVDPYAAVANTAPEQGQRPVLPAPEIVTLAQPVPADPAINRAWLASAIIGVLAIALTALLRRLRRRCTSVPEL